MNELQAIFYGNLEPQGYKISYLLISRKIKHDFVLYDDGLLFMMKTRRKVREFVGFQNIFTYLDNYKYLFDFPEICS